MKIIWMTFGFQLKLKLKFKAESEFDLILVYHKGLHLFSCLPKWNCL